MSLFRVALFSACGLLLGAMLSPAARADEWNKKTVVTFNQPVEIPGQVLQAGTYIFKLADSISDRNMVEVWNADQSNLIATLLTVPDYRLDPTDHSVFEFEERPADSPQALSEWFYPGDLVGQQFIYWNNG